MAAAHDYLVSNPEQICQVKGAIVDKKIGTHYIKKSREGVNLSFPVDKYRIVKQLPKYFLA